MSPPIKTSPNSTPYGVGAAALAALVANGTYLVVFIEISRFPNGISFLSYLKNNYRSLLCETDVDSTATTALGLQVSAVSVLATKKFAQFSIAVTLIWVGGGIDLIDIFVHAFVLLCRQSRNPHRSTGGTTTRTRAVRSANRS